MPKRSAKISPERVAFARSLRGFLTRYGLFGKGLYRWFGDEVGPEDRDIRRWLSGESLPSPMKWARFRGALRRRGITPALDQQVQDLEASLGELRTLRSAASRETAAVDREPQTQNAHTPEWRPEYFAALRTACEEFPYISFRHRSMRQSAVTIRAVLDESENGDVSKEPTGIEPMEAVAAHRHILIEAPPGLGKSFALRQLALVSSRAHLIFSLSDLLTRRAGR
jgi:hypothetical protein